MDTEEGCWNNLPNVILYEIFSYLSNKDRISASSVCKHWRYALYHAKFWQSIHFKIKTNEDYMDQLSFLITSFSRKVRNVTVSFDSLDQISVKDTLWVISKLAENECLTRLILKPSHCNFVCPSKTQKWNEYFESNLIDPIKLLIKTCRRLETLNFGCSETLAMYAEPLLHYLGKYQAKSLTHLYLASIKSNPDGYPWEDLDPELFTPFHALQVLSIDYDYVNDDVLSAISNGVLMCLEINVHGIDDSHPGTSNNAWETFCVNNPNCELHLNLIHSYDAVHVLHGEVLQPKMPLSHLKVLFCEMINFAALSHLPMWYHRTLKSVWWVDSINSVDEYDYITNTPGQITEPDPWVMTAWRCRNLTEIVFIGYKYFGEDLVAIARLRGAGLKRLEIAEQHVITRSAVDCSYIFNEVSKALEKEWRPLKFSKLHRVIRNPAKTYSDEFILPVILQDQNL